VGPVTNAALALVKAPEIAKLLRKIVVMGSTIFHPGIHGPVAPMADANFANDPEAAHIVLRSGADITLVGMDVTMTTSLTPKMIDEVAREGDEAAKTLMRMTEFYVNAYKSLYPGIAGCGLHDPLAVAVAEDPSLARTERMFVDVELRGELTRGQTIADRRGSPTRRGGVHGQRPSALRGEFSGCNQRAVAPSFSAPHSMGAIGKPRRTSRAIAKRRRVRRSDPPPFVFHGSRRQLY
jgi:inosine-uridine nucleoside N-ribohydrolase